MKRLSELIFGRYIYDQTNRHGVNKYSVMCKQMQQHGISNKNVGQVYIFLSVESRNYLRCKIRRQKMPVRGKYWFLFLFNTCIL